MICIVISCYEVSYQQDRQTVCYLKTSLTQSALSGSQLMMSCLVWFLSCPPCTQSWLFTKCTELQIELPSGSSSLMPNLGDVWPESAEHECFSWFFSCNMLLKILQFLMLWQNPHFSLLPLVFNNFKWLCCKSYAFIYNEK